MKRVIKDNKQKAGQKMHKLIARLFPICRSITGNGVRETLKIIQGHIPIKIHEVPTGTKVFDWEVPKEWNIKDAYVKDPRGRKIIDFKKSNLHVLNYSVPLHKKVSFKELKKHLYTLPEAPNFIPYVTSYYKDNWGFSLPYKQFLTLKNGIYEVMIDSSLKEGSLTYGEMYLRGKTKNEILLSCYVCHPSMCNDNLSGIAILTFLAKYLRFKKLNYSYRFLFIPETIGSITWLALNENKIANIKGGLVVTCAGDSGHVNYKKTKDGNTLIDKAAEKALADSGETYGIMDFFPRGSDERQFCSPGFNLAVGSLIRTPYNKFKEYHTSADNLKFVKPQYLADTLKKMSDIIFILENNKTYLNLNPKCEPQLGRRGLYAATSRAGQDLEIEEAMLWVLNFSDGKNSLLDISLRAKIHFEIIKQAADILLSKKLLKD